MDRWFEDVRWIVGLIVREQRYGVRRMVFVGMMSTCRFVLNIFRKYLTLMVSVKLIS